MEDYEILVQLSCGKVVKIKYISEKSNLELYHKRLMKDYNCEKSIARRLYASGKILIEDESGQVVGSCWFHIKDDKPKSCEIYGIEIYDENYIGKGVGSCMMKELEQISISENVEFIFGDFIPYGRFASHSKDFYLRNGFEIMLCKKKNRIIFKKQLGKRSSELENSNADAEENISFQIGS